MGFAVRGLSVLLACLILSSCGGGGPEAGTPPFEGTGAGTPPFEGTGAGTPPFGVSGATAGPERHKCGSGLVDGHD